MQINTPPHLSDIGDGDDDEMYLLEVLPPPSPPEGDEIDYADDENTESDREDVNGNEQQHYRRTASEDELVMEETWDEVEEECNRRRHIKDDALLTFKKHTAPVFSCALHPHLPIAATGSEDDKAIVWQINDGEIVFETNCHKDTVTDVAFSHDGKYLATGDMAGEIFVFKVQTDAESNKITFTEVWKYSTGDMSWLCWHFGAHVLFAGCDGGEIYMWRIPTGDCKIMPGIGSRCEAGSLSADGKMMFAAYANGFVRLWDLKHDSIFMYVNEDHPLCLKGVATAVACDKESLLFMAGDAEGKVLFCTKDGPVGSVDCHGSVECVAFSQSSDMKIAVTGTLSGEIAVWDYARFSLRTVCDVPIKYDGITRLKFISDYTLLASTIVGYIYGFDVRSGECKFTLTGHFGDIYEMAYDPRERQLLTASEDNQAKIFKLPDFND